MDMKQLGKRPSFKIFVAIVALLLIIGLIVGLCANHLLHNRKPIEMNYSDETQELIITSGPFYTLDGHTEETYTLLPESFHYKRVLQLSSDSDAEYRFQVVKCSSVQYLTIYYHDYNGQEGYVKFTVLYDDSQTMLRVAEEKPDPNNLCWYFNCVLPMWEYKEDIVVPAGAG